jgi:PAS domain-containing protein
MSFVVPNLTIITVVLSGAALLLVLFIARFLRKQSKDRMAFAPLPDEKLAFVFQDHELIDATPDARQMLRGGISVLEPWERLMAILHNDFPDFASTIDALPTSGKLTFHNSQSNIVLQAEWKRGVTRIALIEPEAPITHEATKGFSALSDELSILHRVVDDAPLVVWREDPSGAVRWANGAYLKLTAKMSTVPNTEQKWPLSSIFSHHLSITDTDRLEAERLSLDLSDGSGVSWFDCIAQPFKGDTLFFALPADQLVKAETSLREFVQTLTKTFAELPTGLAIFDKNRQLALFNPALTDLTTLEPLFLATRPTLYAFLDHLREKQRMPEPKNYKAWRSGISELEDAAISGTYLEHWSLPTGQTYRVTGRPHPDGALAFLFEDISAEISLTRRFRSELDLGQAVIDSLPEAIAVFSHSGVLILSNETYEKMWEQESSTILGDISIIDSTRLWQQKCLPTPTWDLAQDFITGRMPRTAWTGEVHMKDGRQMNCRFAPVSGNATLIAFSMQTQELEINAPRLRNVGSVS